MIKLSKGTIIIVEDEIIIARTVQNKVESLGYKVAAIVSTAKDAIAKAFEILPDIIIMDIKLKGKMDGLNAATHIRRRLGIPIIFLTAYADSMILKRAKKTEPFHYIVKPFDDDELSAVINIAMTNQKIENKLMSVIH